MTGLGAVSALAIGATAHFDALIEARTALALQRENHSDFYDTGIDMGTPSTETEGTIGSSGLKHPTHYIGGHINVAALLERFVEDSEKMGRHDLFARVAQEEALNHAGWTPLECADRSRTGVVVASAFRNVHEV